MVWSPILLAFVFILTAINAERISLQIQPTDGKKAIGTSSAVSCKPQVPDPSQISQLEWRDPKNRKIEGRLSAPVYVQHIPSQVGLLLNFPKLEKNQGGIYTCSAIYANSEKLTANITIQPFTSITFDYAPESQYPPYGKDFTIKCIVKGDPSPIIQWIRNDEEIVSGERYVLDSEGLIIKNVRESDDGIYKCKAVGYDTGEMKERNIKIEVVIPPKIDPMRDIIINEGETASVKCNATGKPPPSYMWIKERTSEDLSKTDRFDVKKISGDLIINRVEANDDGMYKCVAENQAGRADSKVRITVHRKPRIFELLNVTAPTGVETKITCRAEGRPTPEIIFRKLSSKEPFVTGRQPNDNRIIMEHEIVEEKGEASGSLIITNLTRSDDGLYECLATNTAGDSYKNGHITVEFAPTFERTRLLPQAWSWGERPGNLTCIPEAIPNATITWKYNGLEISESPNFKIIGHGPISNLIVKPLHNPRFYGKYQCIAKNKHGENSIYLKLSEAKVPEHVSQVKTESVTATTIKFNIQPPTYFDNLPIRTFTVRYKREQDFSWDFARNYTWSFNAPYILENLIPETTYHFQIAASNDVGYGPWNNFISVTMPRRSVPAEPKILTTTHIDDTRDEIIHVSPYADHYELRWNVPNDNGDPIDSYLIRYCVIQKINGAWRESDCSEEIRQSVQYNNYELNSLKADTTYKIELRAHNAIGASTPAQIRVKTARGLDPAIPYAPPTISSAAIIGIVVAAVLLLVIFVDLTCYCVNSAGILAYVCGRTKSKKHDEEDAKLGSLYSWRFPLPYCSYKAAPAHPNSLNLPLPVKLAPSPMDEREPLKSDSRNMSVEFDGKQAISKTGEIIGKHSAV